MATWSYAENEGTVVEPEKIKLKTAGVFYKDIASFCQLAHIAVHPCLREPKEVDCLGAGVGR